MAAHHAGAPRHQEARDPYEFARACYFDLLRQLQGAVRAVVLAAQVSGSCVRCSDKLCSELFHVIRNCLLAGCRRFSGVDGQKDDFIFLLVVPEFMAAFGCDLDFIAYLCINHMAASFVRQLFADTARTAHFYVDFAIMRDEELHLAFVSSLLALEPVSVHPDSPLLAQQCMSASLADLRFSPAAWAKQTPGRRATSYQEGAGAGRADAGAPPASDLGARLSMGGEADLFAGFIERPPPRKRVGKIGGEAAEAPHSNGSAKESPEGVREAFGATGEEEPQVRPTEEGLLFKPPGARAAAAEPLLKDLLASQDGVLVLDGGSEPEAAPAAEPSLQAEEPRQEAAPSPSAPASSASPTAWRAADFAAPLGDAFGLDAAAFALDDELPERATISLRDLGASSRAGRGAAQRRPPAAAASRRAEVLARLAKSGAERSFGSRAGPPRLISGGALGRVLELGALGASPRGGGGGGASSSGGEGDEVNAMREALVAKAYGSKSARGHGSSGRCSLGEGAQQPRHSLPTLEDLLPALADDSGKGSTPPTSLPGGPVGHAEPHDCGGWSDSESEYSSGPSVSSAGRLSTQLSFGADGVASTTSGGGGAGGCPAPFGVHLEWRLKLTPRLPQAAQLSLQRGACPSCRERLTSSLFSAPRYCHYLGCYFCTVCHDGDVRIIPARVAERWDFEPRRVCCMAARYLDMQANQPLVPITRIRQTKVSSQAALTEMHALRQRLSRIQDVLRESSCEYFDTLSAILAAQLPPHIAKGHELYTMQDLVRLEHEGRAYVIFGRLQRLYAMGAEHVRACVRCGASAQQCPICALGQPVFRFEVESHQACTECHAAFHRACWRRAGGECPICLSAGRGGGGRRPSIADVRPR